MSEALANLIKERKVLIVDKIDSVQFSILELLIKSEIERLFKAWCIEADKKIEDGVDRLKSTFKQDIKGLKAREASLKAHSKQVESYLAGFNKLLKKLK